MLKKQAFWMRYHDGINLVNAAVVANTLDEAFDKLEKAGYTSILYRNRQIEVLD